jgi:hypothetical protein
MPDHTPSLLLLPILIFLTGCTSIITVVHPTSIPLAITSTRTAPPTIPPTIPPSSTDSPTPEPSITLTATDLSTPTFTLESTIPPTSTPTPLPEVLTLDPLNWKNWPVIPIVTQHAREIFLLGQSLGNDPHSFSVFGDCQAERNVFMGIYETEPAEEAALPPDLQQTVSWFRGSFNRMSPTVRGGTSTGALLWPQWHENKFTCTIYESPLQCELRIHKPSFVIIQVGTHYENRNEGYMRTILDQLIKAGVVPILATKADDRELDEHINSQYAQLAVELNLPFWNFWAAVDGLPNRGLYTRSDATYQGDLYLTDQAAGFHRLSALQTLDVVWRAVLGGQ